MKSHAPINQYYRANYRREVIVITAQELIEATGISAGLAERVVTLMDSDQLGSLEKSEARAYLFEKIEEEWVTTCEVGCCSEPHWKISGPHGHVLLSKW